MHKMKLQLPKNRNTQARLFLWGSFGIFAGLFVLANYILGQNPLLLNPNKPVTEKKLSKLLAEHPQESFKQCLGRVISAKDELLNSEVYRCEKKLYKTIVIKSNTTAQR